MPSFPLPGSVTICEVNRELIVADSLVDSHANDAYGKFLGTIFRPLPFDPNALAVNDEGDFADGCSVANSISSVFDSGGATSVSSGLYGPQSSLRKILSTAQSVMAEPAILLSKIHALSWHQTKNILAFTSGRNQISIHDFEDLDSADPCVLASESQRDVQMLAWRPNGGRTLAVACKGGICIWSASYPESPASSRSGVASFLCTPARGSGVRWALVDFLQSPNGEIITSISWSPSGHNLASSSIGTSSFIIWDVAQGVAMPIRRGFLGISMLKWSPTGDYLFTASGENFYLWETNTWNSETWSSTGGPVIGAVWDPDGRSILVAFSKTLTMGSIQFAQKPPSLDAHLLPVELPELTYLSASVEMIAWDASGERLAVSFKEKDEKYYGLVVVYDTRRTPLISSSIIGFIRGPGERPKPVAFAFHEKLKQGALLSVCWSSGWCCTYPFIFR